MDAILEGDKELVKALKGRLDFIQSDAPVIVKLAKGGERDIVEVNVINPYAFDIKVGQGLTPKETAEMIKGFIQDIKEIDYKRARVDNKRLYALKKGFWEGKK